MPKEKIRIYLQVEADRKYFLDIPRNAKVVNAFLGSPEDGWSIAIDGEYVSFDKIHVAKKDE